MLLLALQLLTLTQALVLTIHDLVDNNGSASALGLDAESLALVLGLERLQTLNLHHEVESFLFVEPLLLELLVFLELLVANGDDLGVQSHLVHVLHVVVLLIKLLLSFGEEAFSSLVLLDFDLRRR